MGIARVLCACLLIGMLDFDFESDNIRGLIMIMIMIMQMPMQSGLQNASVSHLEHEHGGDGD